MVVLFENGILCLVPGNIDPCECLAHWLYELPPAFISAIAALPLSSARPWSLCRMAITIVLTCGMARFNFSGRLLCNGELAPLLSDRYALYSGWDIWCISYRHA